MPTQFAVVLLILIGFSSGLAAQTIYRCGNSYSQTPCPESKTLLIDDSRDPEQKLQSEANTRQQQKLAQALENERLASEQSSKRKVNPLKVKPAHPSAPPVSSADADTPTTRLPTKNTPKAPRGIKFKPDGFVAKVPDAEKKSKAKQSDSSGVATPASTSGTP